MQGLSPELLPLTPANDPVLRAMVWALIIPALIFLPSVVRLWGKFMTSLSRHDEKLPAAERTLTDRLAQIVAGLLCCLMWGVLLYCVAFRLRGGNLALEPGLGVGLTAAGAVACGLIQFVGYRVVGFAFSSPANTVIWIRSLAVNIAMLGYWMIIPSLGAMLYPGMAYSMLWLGAGLFLLFRMALWIKCFRIFYDSPFSIVYFFLYLCTLETVPLLIPVGIGLFIC